MTNKNPTQDLTPAYEPLKVSLPGIAPSVLMARQETERTVLQQLLLLEANYPQTKMPEAQKSLKYQIFCDDLSEYPTAVVTAAFAAYRRNPANTFFPVVAQIRALCRGEAKELAEQQRAGLHGKRGRAETQVLADADRLGMLHIHALNLR